jgi:hypothetical protein
MQYYGRLNGTISNDKVQRITETRDNLRKTEREIEERPDQSEDEDEEAEQ